jgi:hypothetical protein
MFFINRKKKRINDIIVRLDIIERLMKINQSKIKSYNIITKEEYEYQILMEEKERLLIELKSLKK